MAVLDPRARHIAGGVLVLLWFLEAVPQGTALANGVPEVGAKLPNLLAQARVRNLPAETSPPEGGWVIYTFSPSSSWSARNSGSVEDLANSLPPDWMLLSVATDDKGLSSFLEGTRVTHPLLCQVSPDALASYQVAQTPRTYVLDKDWRLLEVLDGPFRGEVARKLARRFNVKVKPPPEKSPDRGVGSSQQAPGKAVSGELCLNRAQKGYSRGAKAEALGLVFRCGPGGVWLPLG